MALLILMGLKHCGKSTLGRLAAQRFGWEFCDLDEEASSEDPEGRHLTPREIYSQLGKDIFQKWETTACLRLATSLGDAVLALGGGTVENDAAMRVLDAVPDRCWIWLDEKPDVLYERVAAFGIPPFLDPLRPKESFLDLANRRRGLAATWKPLWLEISGLCPEKALELLVRQGEEHCAW